MIPEDGSDMKSPDESWELPVPDTRGAVVELSHAPFKLLVTSKWKKNPILMISGILLLLVFLALVNLLHPEFSRPLETTTVDYSVRSTMSHLNCSAVQYMPSEDKLLSRLREPEQRCVVATRQCKCPDPNGASHQSYRYPQRWMRARIRNKKLLEPYWQNDDTLRQEKRTAKTVVPALDVLLVGDSITEHWLGTHYGMRFNPEDEQGGMPWQGINSIYEDLFRNETSPVKGLALGIGNDGYSQLLFRIQDGELAGDHVTAPVVWITIGVNDLYYYACTSEAVVGGIVQVVRAVLHQRAQPTRIVLNSILPLNRKQNLVRQVNELLHCYAQATPHVEFFDATALFVEVQDDVFLGHRNYTLFEDSIHPNSEGYRKFGQAIVHRMKGILKEMRSDIFDWKNADPGV